MAKAGRRKRSQRREAKKKKKDLEFEDEEDEDKETTEQKTRKRSQAIIKQRISQKKKDKLVLAVAAILIILTLLVYAYFQYFSTSDENGSEENGNDNDGPGIYDGKIQVISHETHKYAQRSWHILKTNGFTNYLVRVTNTGTKEDTYKLSLKNLDSNVRIILNTNNFELLPSKSELVIVEATTSLTTEYSLLSPIEIELISDSTKSILGSVEIDLTVKQLDEGQVVIKDDKVAAYYSGVFQVNGSLFDYSLRDPDVKDPLYISLSDDVQTDSFESRQYTPVIPGFRQGIIGMVPGETHVIVVPPELGYPSDQPLGGTTLVFEVNLVTNDRDE